MIILVYKTSTFFQVTDTHSAGCPDILHSVVYTGNHQCPGKLDRMFP